MKRLITPATLIAVLVCASAALAHGSTVGVTGIQRPRTQPQARQATVRRHRSRDRPGDGRKQRNDRQPYRLLVHRHVQSHQQHIERSYLRHR